MWATAQDVRDRWLDGDLAYTDVQLETLVFDAEDIILSEFPNIEQDVNAGRVSLSRVIRVVSRMVSRVLRNPEGIRQRQETRGSYTGSLTYGGDNPGELFLSDDDRRELGGRAGRGRAFSFFPGA